MVLSVFCVASIIISTTPSICRSDCIKPELSNPNRVAIEERTCSGLSICPSISDDFTTSCISVSKFASSCNSNPSNSTFPISFPCRCLTSLNKLSILWSFHWKSVQLCRSCI
ncbi:hypothetical protein FM120_18405 [Sphingobacterium faecium PCAi_F2.5]|nr:hypothetical protein FM120_18405 [Sphingobacterium faecium PCAi_F2.5]